jgi:hypothetical protein
VQQSVGLGQGVLRSAEPPQRELLSLQPQLEPVRMLALVWLEHTQQETAQESGQLKGIAKIVSYAFNSSI